MTNLNDAAGRFQADRDAIERHLAEIQDRWTRDDVTEPAVDKYGEIHPDAEIKLLDLLPAEPGAYSLMDADTSRWLGNATTAQIQASLAAGETGIIKIDADGGVVATGQDTDPWVPKPIRRVYVD